MPHADAMQQLPSKGAARLAGVGCWLLEVSGTWHGRWNLMIVELSSRPSLLLLLRLCIPSPDSCLQQRLPSTIGFVLWAQVPWHEVGRGKRVK